MNSNKKIPMRKCVGCQEMKSKKEMLRVIRTQEGEFLLDATGKKNGRGAYLCPSSDCLAKAIRQKGLERSFKQAIPQDVYEMLEREMREIESKYSPVHDRTCDKGGKDGKRRVLYRKGNKDRQSCPCDRRRRCIG